MHGVTALELAPPDENAGRRQSCDHQPQQTQHDLVGDSKHFAHVKGTEPIHKHVCGGSLGGPHVSDRAAAVVNNRANLVNGPR
jgi:hypothetical protein